MKKVFYGIISGIVVFLIVIFAGKLSFKEVTQKLMGNIVPTSTPQSSEPLKVVTAEPTSDVPVVVDDLLLVTHQNEKGEWDEVAVINKGRYYKIPFPENAVRASFPVIDGNNIYYLINDSKKGIELISTPINGEKQKIITGSTDLVKLRSPSVSSDGKVISFYLDGVSRPMTELWTYDVLKDRKRVSVERLSKNAKGPFWDDNGGFLVRDGDVVMRGTPRRTGRDILPIDQESKKDISKSLELIPSPGGNQVVYLVVDATGKTILKVWDQKTGESREVISFNSNSVQLLGWNSTGALVVREENRIWNVRKDGKSYFDLEIGAHSLKISEDSLYLSYIAIENGQEKIMIRDASSGKLTGTLPLPVISTQNPTEKPVSGENPGAPSYTLVQYLRPKVVLSNLKWNTAGTLAQEEIVRYVMEHIRDISEAPAEEPVTAQRVWFTRVPGAIYVDYLVGTTMWRRLVQIDGVGGLPSKLTVLAVFAPASGEWTVARGKDLADPTTVLLYEYEAGISKWVKKDLSAIQP